MTTPENGVTRAESSYQCAFQWNEEANQGLPAAVAVGQNA